MLSRIGVAVVGIFILLAMFLKGGLSLLLLSEVVVILSTYELLKMLRDKYKFIYFYRPLIISAIVPILMYFNVDLSYIFITIFLLLAISEIVMTHIKDSISKLAISMFVIIYISYLFSYILKIDKISTPLVIFTFLLIWTADSFAYIFGMLLGKHKFSVISPNKSIEGLIGGFIGVVLVSRYFSYIYYFITMVFSKLKIFNVSKVYIEYFDSYSIKLFVFSLIIFSLSVLGDLFESKLKRELNVKDSSHILLGHGGFLDRFDSSLFVIPAMYLFMMNYV